MDLVYMNYEGTFTNPSGIRPWPLQLKPENFHSHCTGKNAPNSPLSSRGSARGKLQEPEGGSVYGRHGTR